MRQIDFDSMDIVGLGKNYASGQFGLCCHIEGSPAWLSVVALAGLCESLVQDDYAMQQCESLYLRHVRDLSDAERAAIDRSNLFPDDNPYEHWYWRELP